MESIEDVFEAFKNKTVLVVGDVMIDNYMRGKASKISAEAPVPVIRLEKQEKRLGGAANVALNIRALGATPILCSVVGDDADGESFEQLLEFENMPNKGIIRSQNRVTTTKLRITSGLQHLIRVDNEDVHPLIDLDQKSLLHHIRNLLDECDLVIFEDYDKGTINPEVIEQTIKLAKEKNIPIAVDPKRRNFTKYQGVSLFKVNVADLKDGLDIEFDALDESELANAAKQLKDNVAADNYFITLSKHGLFYDSGKESGKLEAHKRNIVEVMGAGDTVISISGLCLTLGLPLEFIAELANIAGGIVCEMPGAVPIDREILFNEAKENPILKKYL
ncbi:rfaE bifunctional protein, domain I [Ekhidna lutea]|uniref:RfaE bifunctional protein, domain I n=1 Tax=Ekhidna lutea TaxID=447679 RepID=A0A239IR86_EKHLU|nr:bifunctional ADP-heptose synthase [Ekhidna lutea]SNS96150.1 rfaE bifunctional protein, domain I [Ekhidna lutea]